jgi:hypothetical protein
LTKEVDGLLLTRCENGAEQLIHIELQSVNDADMHERMLLYHVLARVQYHLPIRSCVIYLRQDGNVPQPPLPWKSADGRKTIDFYYEVIELAKLSTAQLRAFDEIGLLPLVPLTKDGARRDKVEEMFTDLQQAGKLDLLQIGKMIASLAFDKQPDNQDWVLRRYRQMYDRLQDTPVYKEMVRLATEKARAEALRESETMIQVALKTAEEARRTAEITQKTTEAALEKELAARRAAEAALEKERRAAEAALEKERQEERKALREVVLALVEKRFPTMLRLTRQVTKGIEHTSAFQTLLLQIGTASTPEEVQQYLLAIDEEEDEE